MSIQRVTFVNGCAFGDLHVSRGLVRRVMQERPDLTYEYAHLRGPSILADVPGLTYVPRLPEVFNARRELARVVGDTLYVNTWYHAGEKRFARLYEHNCFDVLFTIFDHVCREHLGVRLHPTDAGQLLPWIDYDHLDDVDDVRRWVGSDTRPIVLVSNGNVTSDQAVNFPLGALALEVARERVDLRFVLTERVSGSVPANVTWSSDVTRVSDRPDLNEIALLSESSAAIIGRASGPFTFAMTQSNLLGRDVKWLCFCKRGVFGRVFWLGSLLQPFIRFRSPVHQHHEVKEPDVRVILRAHLGEVGEWAS